MLRQSGGLFALTVALTSVKLKEGSTARFVPGVSYLNINMFPALLKIHHLKSIEFDNLGVLRGDAKEYYEKIILKVFV